MTEYTEEDFKNAKFARHPDGRIAMRAEPETSAPWHVGVDQFKSLDADMAARGWRPIVEADHPARPLAGYRAQVKELREKNRRLDAEADGAISLDGLRAAWENAEVPTDDSPIREGDELIVKTPWGSFLVYVATVNEAYGNEDARILHRAPQPELPPWQALADVLGTNSGELIGEHHSITEVAKALHARGVRVTGGDDA